METEGTIGTIILILILILTLAVRGMPAWSKDLHCSFRRLRLMRLMIRPPFVRCRYRNVSNRCLVYRHIFMPMESILELQETKRPQHAPKKPKEHQLLCTKEVCISNWPTSVCHWKWKGSVGHQGTIGQSIGCTFDWAHMFCSCWSLQNSKPQDSQSVVLYKINQNRRPMILFFLRQNYSPLMWSFQFPLGFHKAYLCFTWVGSPWTAVVLVKNHMTPSRLKPRFLPASIQASWYGILWRTGGHEKAHEPCNGALEAGSELFETSL